MDGWCWQQPPPAALNCVLHHIVMAFGFCFCWQLNDIEPLPKLFLKPNEASPAAPCNKEARF